MQDKLRQYVDELFVKTKPTRKAVELKEEMLQNLEDKYRDLITEGKSEETAYQIAISGIGDVSDLFAQLKQDFKTQTEVDKMITEKQRQKSALLTAIAVMMYILAILPVLLLNHVGVPILIAMAAVATGILVYNSMSKPKDHDAYDGDEDDEDEYFEWQTEAQERRQLRKAISSISWTVLAVTYFLVSFLTGMWHITWVIWLLCGAVEALINVFFSVKKKERKS